MPRPKSKKQQLSLADHLPKSVIISGHKILVKISELKSDHGQYDGDQKIIFIANDQTLEQAESTLFHEVIHAALHISGLSTILGMTKEEAVVMCLEQALLRYIDKSALLNKSSEES